MPEKKVAKKITGKKAKPAPKKKVSKPQKGQGYECSLCGYRIIVDEVCGCATEHVFLCCGKPMKRKRATKK